MISENLGPVSATRASYGEAAVDLASVRQNAAIFIDSLLVADTSVANDSRRWFSLWNEVGDACCVEADLNVEKATVDKALEAWLCALTAFEVAKRFADLHHWKYAETSAKMLDCVSRFGLYSERQAELVSIPCCDDEIDVEAYFLPAGTSSACAPSIICISDEAESANTLLGRLLPAAIRRGVSLLVVEGSNVSNRPLVKSEMLLGYCLDYLTTRPDVDAKRIAVFGDKFAAICATGFAASDRRVAAAVCDGGLWNSIRTRASVAWISSFYEGDVQPWAMCRPDLVRRIRCPILVVAGESGAVCAPEAIALQADCRAVGIDMDLATPYAIETPVGAIENFVATDDFVLEWLSQKLTARSPLVAFC